MSKTAERAEDRKSPWRYLGWTIFPILDDETGEVIFYDIHEPGEAGIDWEFDTLPNVEMARAEIRKQHREDKWLRALDGVRI